MLATALDHHRAGRLAQAEAGYLAVLTAHPDDADALHLLALLLHQSGRWQEALPRLQAALALKPGEPVFHLNLARILADLGRNDAEEAFRRAIDLDPASARARNDLASLLLAQGRTGEGRLLLQQALALEPDLAQAHHNLGVAAQEEEAPEEALTHFLRAAALDAPPLETWRGLGRLLHRLGETRAAQEAWSRAPSDLLELQQDLLLPLIPDSRVQIDFARLNLEAALHRDWRLADPPRQVDLFGIFLLAYHGLPNRHLKETFAAAMARACPDLVQDLTPARRRPGPPRVGFLSRHLARHTIGKHFGGLLARMDPRHGQRFLITPPGKRDPLFREVASAVDRVVTLPDHLPAARDLVASLELDLLLYPEVGLDPLTQWLAFARLAPVQGAAWGHPETTGLPHMDFFLSHAGFEAPDAPTHYSERLIACRHVPHFFHRPDYPEVESGPLLARLGLSPRANLYLVPHALFKLHPDFDPWLALLLDQDRDGIILFFHDRSSPRPGAALLNRLGRTLGEERCRRVRCLPFLPMPEWLALCRQGVVLDPPHFSGGTTSLELFAAGIPVVAWPGPLLPSRFTAGYYDTMGYAGPVADSGEAFVALALARPAPDPILAERALPLYENQQALEEVTEILVMAARGRLDDLP